MNFPFDPKNEYYFIACTARNISILKGKSLFFLSTHLHRCVPRFTNLSLDNKIRLDERELGLAEPTG